jgi:hypothetical protein
VPAFEQVGQLGNEAAAAFEAIKTLANNLERLTGTFEPLKCLQDQLALVASSFGPVSSLQGRFAEVSDAFRDHLKHLIGALQQQELFMRDWWNWPLRSNRRTNCSSASSASRRHSIQIRTRLLRAITVKHPRRTIPDLSPSSGGLFCLSAREELTTTMTMRNVGRKSLASLEIGAALVRRRL